MDQKKVSFPLHSFVNEIQTEHGIRRKDYLNFRQYCSKRLRRLRKKLKLTHTNGVSKLKTKFNYCKISDEEVIKNQECLQILILECERSWSYGNQLKQEYTDIKDENSRVRIRYLNRFNKARKKSKELFDICSKIGDELTKIECEAYWKYHGGFYNLEKELWVESKKDFSYCKQIYDTLHAEGSISTKDIYQKRLGSINEFIRICNHWTNDEDEKEGNKSVSVDYLHLKLKKVIEEKRQKDETTIGEIEFLGKKISIENEKLRLLYTNCVSLQKECENLSVSENTETLFNLYDSILTTYRDCLVLIRDDIRKNEKLSNKKTIQNLKLFHSYIDYLYYRETINRNEGLVFCYNEKLNDMAKFKFIKKRIKPEDLIRLYEIILQNLNDIIDLPFIKDSEEMKNEMNAKIKMYKIFKCFYLSKAYSSKSRFRMSYSLVLRVEDLYKESIVEVKFTDEDKAKLDDFISKEVEREKLIIIAKNFLAGQKNEQINLRKMGKITILEEINTYRESKKKNPFLIHFPPSFQTIPCKPLFFDVAGSKIDEPKSVNFEKKIKKKWFGIF